jgi:hypothetical protein
MKLLIIAGPYEADRIRKAAVSAGFETVAVEPGESLSGWITASRPEVIVMAPQMVHPDPAQALAKVRSVPRGRVPIFLVGDAADEVRLTGLGEGFFVRPVSPDALLARARALLVQGQGGRMRTSEGLGPGAATAAATTSAAATPPGAGTAASEFARASRTPRGGSQARSAVLKPLVSANVPPTVAPRVNGAPALLAELDAGIDALLDAELGQVVAATTAIDIPALTPGLESPAEPLEAERHDAAPTTMSPAPSFPETDAAEAQTGAEAIDDARARLFARSALVDDGDYFELLGLARDASGTDVRQAADRLARELGPEGVGPELAGALGPRLETLRAVVAEAARVLGDDRLRARYAAALSEG